MSSTPLNCALNAFNLALKDSAEALVLLLLKKIQYPVRMGEHGSRHGIKKVKPGLVNLVVPHFFI